MSRILLLGAGGHCKSVLDSLLAAGRFDRVGIVCGNLAAGETFRGQPVLGDDSSLGRLRGEGYDYAFVAVGSVGNPRVRRLLAERLLELGFTLPAIVDPTAAVAADAALGPGVFAGKRAVVNAASRAELCAILNTGCIVEHDCSVGAFAHLSPGAVLCGGVTVGAGAHVGAGAAVLQGLSVGECAVVGAGSVVTRPVPDAALGYGNPFRKVRDV